MIKAVVSNGAIVPRDPLPLDWQEGTELTVDRVAERGEGDKEFLPTDAWMNEVETIARQGDQANDKRLDAAIQETRRRQKELARKKQGLTG